MRGRAAALIEPKSTTRKNRCTSSMRFMIVNASEKLMM
jgi:hypothetical protein